MSGGERPPGKDVEIRRLEQQLAESARRNKNLERQLKREEKRSGRLEVKLELARRLSDLDPLTEVFNRRGGDRETLRWTEEVEAARFTLGQPESKQRENPFPIVVSFALLDIDNFKRINDEWGRAAGDAVLVQFVRVLKKEIRPRDYIVRWGGDEFVLGLVGLNKERALRRAGAIGEVVVNRKFRWQDRVIESTISGGISCTDDVASPLPRSLEKYVNWADEALNQAKKGGKNRILLHRP